MILTIYYDLILKYHNHLNKSAYNLSWLELLQYKSATQETNN